MMKRMKKRGGMARMIIEKELAHTKKARVECPSCGRILVPYLENSDYCQRCYREYLAKYSFWKYNPRKIAPKRDTTEYRVCEILISENIKPRTLIKEYGKDLGLTSVEYIHQIREKYLVRCDTFGYERPDIYK